MNNMWWKIRKVSENDSKVIYSYSRGRDSLDGEIECEKVSEKFKILRLAEGDTIKSAERFCQHLWRVIFKENAPDEKIIAIG